MLNNEIEHLKAENERIRQNNVSHELYMELLEENAKLKQQRDKAMELLELATKDIEFLGDHFGCAGCDELRPDWSDHIGDWHDCPFASDKKDECREDWKYQDRYEKLKGEVQNGRDV